MKNEIWAIMVRKKVFTSRDIIDELLGSKYKFLGESFIKNKVKDFIKQQIQKGAITQVHNNVFAIHMYAKDWEKYFTKKLCPICSSLFIPKNSQEKYCSPKCKSKADYIQKKEKKKEYLKTRKDLARKASNKYKKKLQQMVENVSKKGKWSNEEIEILLKAVKQKGKLSKLDLVELANKLGRSFKSVENKYYEVKNYAI